MTRSPFPVTSSSVFHRPPGCLSPGRVSTKNSTGCSARIHNPEYIHHVPGTITCSRDAVKPAEFHFFTTPRAVETQGRDAKQMLDHTGYLVDQMLRTFSAAFRQASQSLLEHGVLRKSPRKRSSRSTRWQRCSWRSMANPKIGPTSL